jgi:hypothetical protein
MRVTSECATASRDGISNASPLGRADASPASAKDTPATPKIGAAFVRRFSFETCLVRDIAKSFHMFQRMFQPTRKCTLHMQRVAMSLRGLRPKPSSMLLVAAVDPCSQTQKVMVEKTDKDRGTCHKTESSTLLYDRAATNETRSKSSTLEITFGPETCGKSAASSREVQQPGLNLFAT